MRRYQRRISQLFRVERCGIRVTIFASDKTYVRFNKLKKEIILRPTLRTLELFLGKVWAIYGKVDLNDE